MKTNLSMHSNRRRRRNERGFFAVIVIMMLLAIMLIYVASNTRVLNELHQELKWIEHKQLQRMDGRQPQDGAVIQSQTNQPAQSNSARTSSP
jgi:hypothetical protein